MVVATVVSSAGATAIGSDGGGVGSALTVTCTSSITIVCPSIAVSRSTYTPLVAKIAVVTVALALLNSTEPGPLSLLHAMVTGGAPPVTVPVSIAVAGSVTT